MNLINAEEWEAVINQTYEVEFDWIGTNRNGQVALFSSFNRGYIPSKVIASFERWKQLQVFIINIKRNTTAKLVTKEKGIFTNWLNHSKKGLFTFDYQDAHRTDKVNRYDLIAQPNTPAKLGDLRGLEQFLDIIPSFHLSFADNINFEQLKENEY